MLKYIKYIGFLLLLCIAGVILLQHLTRPIWFDEAWSIMAYSPLSLVQIYNSYNAPNNHILFNIFLHFYLQSVGNIFPVSEILFRLPTAFIALLTSSLMYIFWKKRIGTKVTFLIVLSFILSPIFIIYGTAVRGYMLSMLFVLCGLESVLMFSTSGKRRYIIFFFISSLLGVAVIPSNLFAFILLIIFPFLQIKNKKSFIPLLRRNIFILLSPFIAFFLFYGPIYRNLYNAIKYNTGWLHPFSACIHLYSGLICNMLPITLIAFFLSIILIKHSKIFVIISIVIIFTAPALVILWHVPAPFPRVFLQMWPIWLYLIGVALKHFFAMTRKTNSSRVKYYFYILVISIISWSITSNIFKSKLSKTFTRQFSQDDLFDPYFMKESFTPSETVKKLVKLTKHHAGQVFLSHNADFPSIIFYGKLQGINQNYWLTDTLGKRKINWFSKNKICYILLRNKEDLLLIEKRFKLQSLQPVIFFGIQKIYKLEN
jgi:hypothetical protein